MTTISKYRIFKKMNNVLMEVAEFKNDIELIKTIIQSKKDQAYVEVQIETWHKVKGFSFHEDGELIIETEEIAATKQELYDDLLTALKQLKLNEGYQNQTTIKELREKYGV